MDLAGFLTARLDEDEAAANPGRCGCLDVNHIPSCVPTPWRERVLREVAVKRKILALHACEFVRVQQPGVRYQCSGCSQEWWPCQTLEALADIYSDHPDYDPAWKA